MLKQKCLNPTYVEHSNTLAVSTSPSLLLEHNFVSRYCMRHRHGSSGKMAEGYGRADEQNQMTKLMEALECAESQKVDAEDKASTLYQELNEALQVTCTIPALRQAEWLCCAGQQRSAARSHRERGPASAGTNRCSSCSRSG